MDLKEIIAQTALYMSNDNVPLVRWLKENPDYIEELAGQAAEMKEPLGQAVKLLADRIDGPLAVFIHDGNQG